MAGRAHRRGFGHVRKLPSKRFQVSYVGPDLARHKAPTTFTTKADAEAWLGACRHRIENGTWEHEAVTASRKPTGFADYAIGWLEDRPLKPKTRNGYQHLLDRYLLPVLGPLDLGGVTPSVVRGWWAGLGREHPTANARAHTLLKSILNTAVEDELITVNPCRIRAPSNPPRAGQIRPATLEELDVITAAMPDRFQAAVLLGAWCALRIGEILELRRMDVDVDAASVSVARAVSWVKGQPVGGTPKSSAGTRVVAVPPRVLPAIRAHLDEHVGEAPGALLFPSRAGRDLQPSVFHSAWRKARAEAGREDLRAHDLRHTGATLAAMTGASLAELQQRLGHSSVGAAMRYQHAAQGRDAQIAQLLSELATGRDE